MTAQIPVVDPRLAMSEDAPRELLDSMREAAERVGIIQVVGHSVPEELIDGFHDAIGRVLALPREEKAALANSTGHPFRGWRQWPDDFGRLELERFNIGQFDSVEQAVAAGLPEEYAHLYSHPDVWPEQEPELRDLTRRYHDASVGVAERVLELYARVLDVPPSTFPVSGRPYYTSFVVNDYPTWTLGDAATDEEKLLLLEHADGSALTVLHQRGDYAGLQGQAPDGSWIPVPIVPGALQVFSGHILAKWTNDRLTAGRHRVVADGTVARRSTGVFWHPSLDTVIEPLAPFVGPDGTGHEPHLVWDRAKNQVEDYLQVFGRPDQVAAWRERRPYVAELSEV
ncbi:2-oxoglutarate and iron-dependent oxygenase domain-containing protein [Sphaerisporangium sp. TRM90804]|uniref:2-oxoglutarate and iron-dependent oxygenase domain-containing protein n=1 Tax=Sphaerisporangium sp. TRM90804 TaxID=3031113 RepID=UPI002447F7EA|nr:2-oxoglutarate and iron-dependent oxygenase domain-containing protein [Sphaerisporangium sp. TRM90804]MDH2428893.1 2-oxoglutarate and iron-dependent oxygenase domain-containing protein [Sphaerisporangium sp. TRM90804]